jgi:hypothetical protein
MNSQEGCMVGGKKARSMCACVSTCLCLSGYVSQKLIMTADKCKYKRCSLQEAKFRKTVTFDVTCMGLSLIQFLSRFFLS